MSQLPRAFLFALTSLIALALVPALAAAAPPPGGQLTIAPTALAFETTTVNRSSSEEQIEVRNESAAPVSIFNTSFQGVDPSEFSTGKYSCPPTLEIGQSCTIGIFFSPHNEGEKQALFRIQSGGSPGEQDVELSAAAVPPQLSFEPGSYDFGLQPINGEGNSEAGFQLRNSGAAAIHLDFIGFQGSGSGAFNVGNTNCFGATLAAGEACSLQVQFRPQQTVTYVAQLQAGADGVNFNAALSGEGGDPVITATPNPLEFAPASVGSLGQTETLTLSNSGNLPAGFFIAFLTGGDVNDFRLLSEDCTATPVLPGATCTAQVRFAPSSAGTKSAKLSFIGNGDGPLQLDLKGTALAPSLRLDPAGLAFGTTALGGPTQSQVATLTNTGDSQIAVDGASITGADSDQFRLSDSCGSLELSPGNSCRLTVRFDPDSEGPKGATLRVIAGAESRTVALSGTAVAPNRADFRPPKKRLRPRGSTLNLGPLRCESLQSCSVNVHASISARVRVHKWTRRRSVALHPLKFSVLAQGAGDLRLHLTHAARQLLAREVGHARLHVQLRLDVGGQPESRSLGLRVQP